MAEVVDAQSSLDIANAKSRSKTKSESSSGARLLATRCGTRIYFTIADIPPPSVLSLTPLQPGQWLSKHRHHLQQQQQQQSDATVKDDQLVTVASKQWIVSCSNLALNSNAQLNSLTTAAEVWSGPEVQGDQKLQQQQQQQRHRRPKQHEPRTSKNSGQKRESQLANEESESIRKQQQQQQHQQQRDQLLIASVSSNRQEETQSKAYYTSIRRLRRDRIKFDSSLID